MAQTIYNPEYMEALRLQVESTRGAMEQSFGDLSRNHEGHGGLWEDAEGNGPCATFGVLIADFQSVMTSFMNNPATTAGNVHGYENAMHNVSTSFNFAANG